MRISLKKFFTDVVNTKCFKKAEWFTFTDDDSKDSVCYVITYRAKSEEAFNEYQEKYAKALQKEHTELWAGKFAASRRLLFEKATFE